ncbi:MAG: hypothetical protein J6H18_05040 [Lachnospiraceae bacterium]|nr:hypothetical protein [Lachnospiraceae bacterium]
MVLIFIGLLLLILLLLCLVPIRYRLKGRYQEKLKLRGDVTWLLHLVHIWGGAINLQILCKIRLLGFTLKKLHIGNWGEEPEPEEKIDEASDPLPGESSPALPKEAEAKMQKGPEEKKESDQKKPEPKKEEKKKEENKKEEKKKEKYEALFEALDKREQRKQEALKKAEESAGEQAQETPEEEEGAAEGLEKLRQFLEQADAFWEDEANQKAVRLLERQLMKLGRHLLPTRFQLEGEIGLSDPAATGRLVGQIYRFYPLYGSHIRVDGIFDRKEINLYGDVRGRFRLGILVEILIRLALNKRLREWFWQLRRKDHQEEDGEEDRNGDAGKTAASSEKKKEKVRGRDSR